MGILTRGDRKESDQKNVVMEILVIVIDAAIKDDAAIVTSRSIA